MTGGPVPSRAPAMSWPLIGLAHGSRDFRAAETIAQLMAAVARRRPGLLAVPAFLDLAEPDLVAALRDLPAGPAIVVPLLFSEAFHARIDVPDTVSRAAAGSGRRLVTAGIIGLGDEVLAALQAAAVAAGIDGGMDVVLLAVGSSQPHANAAVAELAIRWSGLRGGAVRPGFATCEPRGQAVLAELRSAGRPVGVVPLFLAPGLLLDEVVGSPAAAGCPVAAPLGDAMAELVLRRYDTASRAG